MMRILSNLNGIAARIAVAFVLAIFLGMIMQMCINLGYLSYHDYGLSGKEHRGRGHFLISAGTIGYINPNRNLAMRAGKIAVIVSSLASSPRAERLAILTSIVESTMQVALDAPPLPETVGRIDSQLAVFRQLIEMQLEEQSPVIPIRVFRPPGHGDEPADPDHPSSASTEDAMVEAALPDGQQITFTVPDVPSIGGYGFLIFLTTNVLVSILVAFWTARRLARPIREFARAAERLGVDLTAPSLAVRGPQELRTTIAAFNRMQDRLKRFLEDRTQMLAAISHDMRAPLARLRLRAELVTDGEQQRKMFDDLDVMNAMIDSTLAFARDESRQEPRRLVDLGVLVGDICEDVADAGGTAAYLGPRGVDVSCRPTLVGRAVANLIDNAIKYGCAARVRIDRDSDRVVIVVDDDGPGIPVEEQEKVFAPFYRLEAARDPGKAGVGLGLSIARTVAREHGGDVMLKNRDNGGLSALIELPA
jgi:signal transduction histidine kinase